MELLKSLFVGCYNILNIKFDLFGFDCSLWIVFLISAVLTILGRFIWGLFD